ncbi:unnamed protein product [Rhizoctonia solani]|uniref:CxC2-like cysteine cluster KDZ transposase-associated domain-containing protein n=1 Tax=Rhizoctonia solani TaxID=456999 RepID=A0A8H3DWL5_9AGAM|nr:unnamed protein product [Rhizoctonia solani]
MSRQKRKRVSSAPLVTVELDLDDSSGDEKPSELPKRSKRPGRPKAAPSSLEFDVRRIPSAPVYMGTSAPGTSGGLDSRGNACKPSGIFDNNPTSMNNEFINDHQDPECDEHTTQAHKKTPNDNLREWLDFHLDDYLDTLYDRDSPPTSGYCSSAMTFPLLEMYDALATRARTSGYKYYSALQQLTKPGFTTDVEDRYRELMWTYRVFLHLLQLRRSGRKFPLHPDIDVHPGDQAVDCAACPRPGVNFEWDEVPLQESFIYSVYALGALLCYINERRGGCVPLGLTYDPIAIPPSLDLIAAVPKWHLVGHDRECYVRYSLDNMQYTGRIDGEGPERFWAHINQHSGSTSEQSPAVRTDTMNNVIRNWNEDKGFNLNETLPARYKHAKKTLTEQKEIFEDLTEYLPEEGVKRWKEESIEPVQGRDKKWTSPLMDPVFDGGFYDTVKEERQKEAPTARVVGRRPGAARWLSSGIELEHSIRNFNEEAKQLGPSATLHRSNTHNTTRSSLRDRIEEHRKKRELYMDGANEPDRPRLLSFYGKDAEKEEFDLAMPSSYSAAAIESAGLTTLAAVEKELRRALCKESIECVKQLLGAKKATQNYKKKNVRGQVANTRANTILKDHDQKIGKAQWRYMNSRSALIQLGFSEADKQFEVLADKDLQPLVTYFAEYARSTGHGYSGISWIWKTSVAPNTKEWEVTALKTEWFRSRERYKRWEEELVILKREMVMSIRTFLKFQELWEWKSVNRGVTPGMRAYACGRARFYAQHAMRVLISCREHLYDNSVELRWANKWMCDNVIVDGSSIRFVQK